MRSRILSMLVAAAAAGAAFPQAARGLRLQELDDLHAPAIRGSGLEG